MKLTRTKRYPLFWCLTPQAQADLMRYQYDVHGLMLDPPAPPGTSDVIWAATWLESHEDYNKLLRQAPQHQRRVT